MNDCLCVPTPLNELAVDLLYSISKSLNLHRGSEINTLEELNAPPVES